MSLTLRGFKSFASATTFEFAPGINAVVGPNGSGKSNVLDALAWVMGEQGAKSLRGGSMKDVIFAGSGDGVQRAPLGRAKVTLTFDNSDGTLSIPADRVQISRTMFRSGGSEYEINGSPARLSDIQDLLSEAGLGQDMHVLVGQGQLDAVLHATSQQRRDMIEQAAGVVKYRRRQEKTNRKLESVASNLTRLSDLARELDSQLQPLSDQAESAATARQLQGRIRQLEAVLLARQLGALQAEQAQALASESEGTRRAETLKEQLEAARAASAKHQQEQNRLNVEVTACQKAVSTLRESAARVRTVQSIAAERVRTYRVELTEATAAARAGYERALELQQERREEAERAVESYASFEERYDAALKNVEKAASEVAQTERASGEAAQSRARAQAQLDAARAAAVEATRAYAAAAERAATLREALGQSLGEAPAEPGAESAEAVFDPETGELMDSSSEGSSLLRVLDGVQIDPEYARAASAALTSLATAALSVPVEGAEVSHLRGDKGDESSESAAKELSTELPEFCAAELRELGIRPATEIIEPLSEDAAALAGHDEHVLPQPARRDPAQHSVPVRLLGGVHDIESLGLPAVMRLVPVGVTDQTGARDPNRAVDRGLADSRLACLTGVRAHTRTHADRADGPHKIAVVEGRGLPAMPPVRPGVRTGEVPRQRQSAQSGAVLAHSGIQDPPGRGGAVDLLHDSSNNASE